MLAVHLTVEEGLKLKIAMKGGLREKIRGSYVKKYQISPFLPKIVGFVQVFISFFTISNGKRRCEQIPL